MSDPNENIDDDLTSYSVDDEDQLQPQDTLIDDDVEDSLDRGYSPSDTARGSTAWGTTAYEQSQEETIDQRILQEEPDPDSAYGAPDNESGLDTERLGGTDEDAIDADDDWIGSGEVGTTRAGRLVAPDEGAHDDDDSQEVASDVGIDGAGASAEEAAVHIIDSDDGEDH
ncbi:MAG: DUF5709 domain-containing protein [Micrococcales bacterium]|nr:DUF5709 domain-containing protein [Micrococcales bacterium]